MSKFKVRMFSDKEAYLFGKQKKMSTQKRLMDELVFQLQDLEGLWLKLYGYDQLRSFALEITYQRHCERLYCRLEELLRFLKKTNGPRIITYVCTEIYDMLKDYQMNNNSISAQVLDHTSTILTVMSSYLLNQVLELDLMSFEEFSKLLHDETEKLLSEYFGESKEFVNDQATSKKGG